MTSPKRLRLPALRDHFLAELTKEQARREELGLHWVLHERQTMCDIVNAERTRGGLRAVAIADIERVETMAEGHSDYSSKFALYCAEIALGITVVT